MVDDKLAVGHSLYAALQSGDAETLRSLLSEDFVGDLTPGLPNGYGAQKYEGREAMLTDGWGRVGQDFAITPQVDELLATEDYLIGRGRYVGTAVATGRTVEARFAHFWRMTDGKITRVVQVTDSANWERALAQG